MFDALLPRIRKVFGVDTVRFRLTHAPSRPIVEPVLKKLWFAPERAWLGFTLAKKTPLPKLEAIKGVKFREGGIDDLADIVRLDREAFPDTPMPTDAIRKRIEQGECVLLATAGGAAAGCALFERIDGGDGYLWVLTVGEAYRGRGIGAALTVRAAKALFAEGAEAVTLRTEEDNAAAIRLYVGLGFRQTTAGCDYTRPTDPRAITRMKQTSRGTLIRFGGWR
jgi:ribosomal protein S18 acetylase RimI-like enzyme